jgi:hypothetical protein
MSDIRDMAIQNLAKDLDSVDRILLGKAYGLSDWLLAGCKGLTEREETISGPEGRRLGPDTVAGLCQIREAGIKASVQPGSTSSRHRGYFKIAEEQYNYENRIRQVFCQEFANAETAGNIPVSTARLQPWPIDKNLAASANSQPVRNERFYMEDIIFLVRNNLVRGSQRTDPSNLG